MNLATIKELLDHQKQCFYDGDFEKANELQTQIDEAYVELDKQEFEERQKDKAELNLQPIAKRMRTKKRQLFNIVLIHVARTWERIRVKEEFEEMPLDNLESLEAIEKIANDIMEDKHIVNCIKTQENDYFSNHTNKMSDEYIEGLAEELIKENYL